MINEFAEPSGRTSNTVALHNDLVVIGGGLAGVCAAVSAARSGVKVLLVQDRPVLGGNASSEVRLWTLGATSHMGNNNRWSREGGIIGELLVENMYRNKEGNTLIFDTILLEKVVEEENITLLLNTAVFQTHKSSATRISSVEAFCSQNSTHYSLSASHFCDASGDGIVAFQAGAAFRMGAESKHEFGELVAPEVENQELLGHSIYFYSKDTGKPVKFVPPSYASMDRMTEDRIKRIRRDDAGPKLWWLEYGGNCNTINESEDIKWQLWKVVYGIWDYIKNSGKFENVEDMTLEWVGTVPGKRESRRFIGHSFMTQQDVVEQRSCDDAISFGGWAIDHHPGDGVYSDKAPCTQYHSKGIYPIPLGSFISRDIENLFYAGRTISASHIAFGSTRVMATCAHGGQAVGAAAAYCIENQISPAQALQIKHIENIRHNLNETAHFVPFHPLDSSKNLATNATIVASSELVLGVIPNDDIWKSLDVSAAQLLPLKMDTKYAFTIWANVSKDTELTVQLRRSEKTQNFTPEIVLEEHKIALNQGLQELVIPFKNTLNEDQYAALCFMRNDHVELACSNARISGIVSVFNGKNKAVSNNGKQIVESDKGIDEFEFWIPERRPKGHNFAMKINPPIKDFNSQNIVNGYSRPFIQPNAWVAELDSDQAYIDIKWDTKQTVDEIILHFDVDYDHAMESSLYGHPEDRVPFCISDFQIEDHEHNLIAQVSNNYQGVVRHSFEESIKTSFLRIRFTKPNQFAPVAVFEIIVK